MSQGYIHWTMWDINSIVVLQMYSTSSITFQNISNPGFAPFMINCAMSLYKGIYWNKKISTSTYIDYQNMFGPFGPTT